MYVCMYVCMYVHVHTCVCVCVCVCVTPILLNKNASYLAYDLPHEGLSPEPKLLWESPIKKKPCGNVNFILKF